MAGRVIQGFFLGGRMHPMPGLTRATPVQRAAVPALRSPGPPQPAFASAGQPVQRHGGNGSFAVDPSQLGLARGGGNPLPQALRTKMEAAFGADFSAVRVHVGPQAARIGAIAFTTGNDLYFAPGRYQPESVQGQQLIGHELAHVIQQRQGRVRAPGSGVSVVQDDALEAEADRLGMRAAMHRALPMQAKAAPGAPLQRQGAPGGDVRISAPIPAGNGKFRLAATAGATAIGSVMVHTRSGGTAHITDLEVSAAHRDKGVGRMLLASAARTGMAHGNARVSLHADDNGSGRLNRWYKALGFAEAGARMHGQARFEAPAMRVAAPPHGGRPVQRMHLGGPVDPRGEVAKLEYEKSKDGTTCVLLVFESNNLNLVINRRFESGGGRHAEHKAIAYIEAAVANGTLVDRGLPKDYQAVFFVSKSPCSYNAGTSGTNPGCQERLEALRNNPIPAPGGGAVAFQVIIAPSKPYGGAKGNKAKSIKKNDDDRKGGGSGSTFDFVRV